MHAQENTHTHRLHASKVSADWRKSKKVKTPATRSSGVLDNLIVKAFNQAHMTRYPMKTRGKMKTKTTALQGNPLLWQPAQLFCFFFNVFSALRGPYLSNAQTEKVVKLAKKVAYSPVFTFLVNFTFF